VEGGKKSKKSIKVDNGNLRGGWKNMKINK
jgi:hypothetical protein